MVNGLEVVREEPVVIDLAKSARAMARIMDERKVKFAVIRERGHLLGVIDRSELDEFVAGRKGRSIRGLVRYGGTLSAASSNEDAIRMIKARPKVRAIPVLQGSQVVGIVRRVR
ncbi:CBS domain-containing protein [Kitasatospora sp. NPDC051170]|uniref:CBS domain-containing protein n=1 Tax=Kitasatospora sp. NPDC051170 TaxID=3364056 RepID=UPI00379CC0AA